jgi:hypothetical protein
MMMVFFLRRCPLRSHRQSTTADAAPRGEAHHSQASSLARPSDLSGHELPTVWGVYGLARGRSEGWGASASGPRLCAMLRHQRIANLYAWRIFLRRARRTRVRRCCARSHAVLAQAPPAVRVGRHRCPPPAGLLHPEVVVPHAFEVRRLRRGPGRRTCARRTRCARCHALRTCARPAARSASWVPAPPPSSTDATRDRLRLEI